MTSLDSVFAEQVRLHPQEARSHFEIVDPEIWQIVQIGANGYDFKRSCEWVGPFEFLIDDLGYVAWARRDKAAASQRAFLEDWGIEIPRGKFEISVRDIRKIVGITLFVAIGGFALVFLWPVIGNIVDNCFSSTAQRELIECHVSMAAEEIKPIEKNVEVETMRPHRRNQKTIQESTRVTKPSDDTSLLSVPLIIGLVVFVILWGLLKLIFGSSSNK